jgi:hypothetical protein
MFLLHTRDDMVQFDQDIRAKSSIEGLRPPTKPLMEAIFSGKSKPAKWMATTSGVLSSEYDQLMEAMDKARRETGYVAIANFCVAGSGWPWKKSRHRKRDWPPLIRAAVFESRLVTFYRAALLRTSAAGVRLRDGIAQVLGGHVKATVMIAATASGSVGTEQVAKWTYLDGIVAAARVTETQGPSFKMETFVAEEASRKRKDHATRALQGIVTKIEKLPFVKVDLGQSSPVSREVTDALTELIRAISVNFAVLEEVKRHQTDDEEDIAIDPTWYTTFDTPEHVLSISRYEAEVRIPAWT